MPTPDRTLLVHQRESAFGDFIVAALQSPREFPGKFSNVPPEFEEVRCVMKFLVVIEQGPSSFGAYVPDLPGSIAVGETRDEVIELIQEAIEFHLNDLRQEGFSIPQPHSFSEFIEVHA